MNRTKIFTRGTKCDKGIFNITGTLGATDEEATLTITDMAGQVVYSKGITANSGVLNEHIQLGNTIANGMYLLTVHSATQNTVLHMVVTQ